MVDLRDSKGVWKNGELHVHEERSMFERGGL